MNARHDTLKPPRFALTTAVIGDVAVGLTVRGELDIATVGHFEAVLRGVLAKPGLTRLVLDFAPLTSLDARSITALHLAHNTATRRGIKITATNCRAIVRRALEITGMYGHLTQN
jgi:anti-anti-sigma factor